MDILELLAKSNKSQSQQYLHTLCWGAAEEISRLRAAIKQTLDENGHLADGDNCTLIVLKNVIKDKLF